MSKTTKTIICVVAALAIIALVILISLGNSLGLFNGILFNKSKFNYYDEWQILEAPNLVAEKNDNTELENKVVFDKKKKTIYIAYQGKELTLNIDKISSAKDDKTINIISCSLQKNDFNMSLEIYANTYSDNTIAITQLHNFDKEWKNMTYMLLRRKNATKESLFTKEITIDKLFGKDLITDSTVTSEPATYNETAKTYNLDDRYEIFEASDTVVVFRVMRNGLSNLFVKRNTNK